MKKLLLLLAISCPLHGQTILSAVTPQIGPFTVGAGGCLTQAVTVTGAVTTGNTASTSPRTFPGNGITWIAYISAANTVTVKVCNSIAGTIGGSIYDVTVQQPGSGGTGVSAVTATAPVTSSGGTTPNIACPTCATGTPVASVAATSPIQSSGGTTPTISCPTCATGTPVTSVGATSPIVSSGGTTPSISCPTCATGTPVTNVTAGAPIVSSGGVTPNLTCPTCETTSTETYHLISTSTPSGTGTVTFSGIPATYSDLIVVVRGAGTAALSFVELDFTVNGDTGANYDFQTIIYQNTTFSGNSGAGQTSIFGGWLPAASGVASAGGQVIAEFLDYADTSFQKSMQIRCGLKTANTTAGTFEDVEAAWWRNTAAITSVTATLLSGNFASGSTLSLYGRK